MAGSETECVNCESYIGDCTCGKGVTVSRGNPVLVGYVEPPLLHRFKWRAKAAVWAVRRRLGTWIAGASPDEWEERN